MPQAIVSDNGNQFAGKVTQEFCASQGIQMRFAYVEHPQSNGQAEAANKAILNGIKTRLDEAKGRWPEELPAVLWSYNTKVHTSTGETPYKLTYGADAMIPVEIQNLSWRANFFDQEANSTNMLVSLDLLPEIHEVAKVKTYAAKQLAAKQLAARRYNSKVVPRAMKLGDLVLRKRMDKTNVNKLSPNWEGPFRISEVVGNGAYHLTTLDGKKVPRSRNASHLKPYFS